MKLSTRALVTIASVILEDELIDEEDTEDETEAEALWYPEKLRNSHRQRKRRYVNSIFFELGPYYVKRAYRMDQPTFWLLLKILDPYLKSQARYSNSTIQWGGGAKNGMISNATRLSCALRYFAGGRAEDICLVHGISHCQVFRSVWRVVDAVNRATKLRIQYPNDHEEQKSIAAEFKECSQAGFDNCGGAIDGMLIWTEQPTIVLAKWLPVDASSFSVAGRRSMVLGCRPSLCDAHCRFLDVSIGHPATTSDFLAFSTSGIFYKLKESGFLAEGLCIFGDNAYVNTDYMVTPYRNVRSGAKDDYNFYHSQASIASQAVARFVVIRNILTYHLLATAVPGSN